MYKQLFISSLFISLFSSSNCTLNQLKAAEISFSCSNRTGYGASDFFRNFLVNISIKDERKSLQIPKRMWRTMKTLVNRCHILALASSKAGYKTAGIVAIHYGQVLQYPREAAASNFGFSLSFHQYKS